MRYAACIEYDGSHFSGWQTQKHDVRTVQEEVEASLSKVADHEVAIITAGRTDTGVHATHQVIHFDSDSDRSLSAWVKGTNRFMSHDVRIKWVVPVDKQFHARFSALSRSYRFVIYNAPVNSALYRKLATHEYRELDIERMRSASAALIGKHDFTSFRAAGCQAHSPIRNLTRFELRNQGHWIWFDVTANAFLQHMVRNIAGNLIEVGYGKRDADWVDYLLTVKDRTQAGITAPPYGLYLTGVSYPDNYHLPDNGSLLSYWGR